MQNNFSNLSTITNGFHAANSYIINNFTTSSLNIVQVKKMLEGMKTISSQ